MYEVTITRDYKIKEKYIATEFKTIKSRGIGNCIPKEERILDSIKIKPEGKNRYKHYSIYWESILIKDLESNEIVLDWECKCKSLWEHK